MRHGGMFRVPVALTPLVIPALALLLLAGCSGAPAGPGAGKPTGTVTGTIKLKGKAVGEGTLVTFLGGDGVAATGKADSTGKYTLSYMNSSGIPEGTYKVSLTPYTPANTTSNDPAQFFDMKTGATKPPPVVKSDLPSKYSNPATSGITEVVKKGPNVIDMDLQ